MFYWNCRFGWVQNEEDINRLIKKADDLLYQIKTTGKGRYIFI